MKQLTKMIGSLTAKFAALLLTFGLAGGAWGAGATLTPSGTTMTPGAFKAAITAAGVSEYNGAGVTVDFSDLTDVGSFVHNSEGPQVYILGDQNDSPTTSLTIKNVKFELPSSATSYEKMQLYL